MTQKDKIKELVGKGLNSYHTKALQQIDRIEKKNKEQNHKISILSNELDNDYLTKTEEGSVVSLEHSKEGMVYLDELQGNTLVNYCIDGSKEMTLNGDIDLEGTYVTTTEGVDNGLVDVICEGNTLVNCIKDASIKDVELIATTNGGFVQSPFYALDKFLFKPNTVYTFVALLKENTIDNSVQLCCSHSRTAIKTTTTIKTPLSNTIVFTFTTKEDFTGVDLGLYHQLSGCTSGKLSFTQMILEGDWTNKEIPPYFEGMKSVGQDDENGHKIEILSTTNNLLDLSLIDGLAEEGDKIVAKKTSNGSNSSLRLKPNTRYKVTMEKYDSNSAWIGFGYRINGIYTFIGNTGNQDNRVVEFTTPNERDIIFYVGANGANDIGHYLRLIKLEYANSSSNSSIAKHNKKEILLNEPLRGLPNGVKDRFVKIGGKWFIERNCKEVVFLEEYIDHFYNNFSNINKNHIGEDVDWNTNSMVMCDKFVYKDWGSKSPECISTYNNNTLRIYSDIYNSIDLLKGLIRDKGIKMVFKLLTPTYEPLEINPELLAYTDTTHISNNSIIPCNMKIKNSGYNAIIKPSTLYTIALDTNKNGTIGMNLGGVKGTTTNNVLTLTTPATLTDDSLRLYGKGIKGSKVRLLEGDKTNWIPSHFEGMKSSFEDKFDSSDNTYKMEILSSNKNMFNKIDAMKPSNWLIGTYHSFKMQLKPNTRYSVSVNYRTDKPRWMGIFEKPYNYDGMLWTQVWNNGTSNFYKSKFTTPKDGVCYLSVYSEPNTIENRKQLFNEVYNDLTIQEEIFGNETIIQNSNKIQFSSIEPLRGVDNIKDKFVFKDGKLMIERNCKELRLTTENLKLQGQHGANTRFYYDVRLLGFDIGQKPLCVENLKQVDFYDKSYTSKSSYLPCYGYDIDWGGWQVGIYMPNNEIKTLEDAKIWLDNNVVTSVWKLAEPTYEEIPFELQKIILEGYENGTLFFDTNIPPTSTVTYAGETPIVKSVKLNKTEVLNNTNDINDNIIPYLMDMDYRVVCLQLQSEEFNDGVAMARLFGGAYEMLKRDILSKRLTKEEYGYRLADYFNAGKLTEQEVRELEDLI